MDAFIAGLRNIGDAWMSQDGRDELDDLITLHMQRTKIGAEMLAQQFHETYERLAPSFEYATREESRKPWADVPAHNKALMIAVCRALLAQPNTIPATGTTKQEE